jgi:hypothetical protein
METNNVYTWGYTSTKLRLSLRERGGEMLVGLGVVEQLVMVEGERSEAGKIKSPVNTVCRIRSRYEGEKIQVEWD